MKTLAIACLAALLSSVALRAQVFTLTKEQLTALTASSPETFERFPDGRPKVPDALIERARAMSAEEAWTILNSGGGPMSGWLACQTFFILPGTRSYARMEEDAAAFGTEIRHKMWWKEAGDHFRLATDVLPSAAWRGRERELTAFPAWNQSVNQRWGSRYPADVMQFRTSFYVDE